MLEHQHQNKYRHFLFCTIGKKIKTVSEPTLLTKLSSNCQTIQCHSLPVIFWEGGGSLDNRSLFLAASEWTGWTERRQYCAVWKVNQSCAAQPNPLH